MTVIENIHGRNLLFMMPLLIRG